MVTKALDETILALQDCLCTALDAAVEREGSLVKPVCLCSVISGDNVPLDYCGPDSCGPDGCGMAWVRLTGVQIVDTGPSAPGCAAPMQAVIEVGIARCSLTMIEDDQSLPGPEEHLAETLMLLDDLQVMRQAVGCCTEVKTTIMGYTPFGPEGGCVGGAFNILVDVL